MFDFNIIRNDPAYAESEKFVLEIIHENNYPLNHPLLEYPTTPSGFVLTNIILLRMLGIGDDIITDIIRKCKSIENNKFNHYRYRQNINEFLFLYYLLIYLKYKKHEIPQILYENKNIIDNNKVPEYSLLFNYNNKSVLMNIEVKTLSCDALPEGKTFDGQKLIMPYHKDKEFIERLKKEYPDAKVLEDKCCLFQLQRNIIKINKKFKGKNLTPYLLFNVGVIFIDGSSSIEQFFSYLFNEKFGLINNTDLSAIDALIFFTLDAKVDMLFSNIYNSGYIQTLLLNSNNLFKNLCKTLRLDNYILVDDKIFTSILEKAKDEYEVLKILKREKFINIIPYNTTEDEINEYLNFLRGDHPRNFYL